MRRTRRAVRPGLALAAAPAARGLLHLRAAGVGTGSIASPYWYNDGPALPEDFNPMARKLPTIAVSIRPGHIGPRSAGRFHEFAVLHGEFDATLRIAVRARE